MSKRAPEQEEPVAPVPDPPAKGWRVWRKWVLRSLLGVCLLVVVGLLGGMWWLSSSAGEAWLQARIQSAVDEALSEGRGVVGPVKSNGWTKSALQSLEIFDGDEKVIDVRDIRMEYRLWGLLGGHFNVVKLTVGDLDAALRLEDNGQLNVERLFASSVDAEEEGGVPISIGVKDFRVSQIDIDLQDQGSRYELRDAELALKLFGQDGNWDLSALKLNGHLDGEVLNVSAKDARLGEVASVAGGVVDWNGSLLKLGARSEQDLVEVELHEGLVDFGPHEERLGFALNETLEIQGFFRKDGDRAALDLDAQFIGGSIKADLKEITREVQGDVRFEKLQAFRLDSALGPDSTLSGEIQVLPSPLSEPKLALTMGATTIAEEKIEGLTGVFALLEEGLQIETVRVRHEAAVLVASGVVQDSVFEGVVESDVASLSDLADLGLEGVTGAGRIRGDAVVNWKEDIRVDFDGLASGRRLEIPGGLLLGSLQGPVKARLRDNNWTAEGGFKGQRGEAGGAQVGSVFGAWQVDAPASDSLQWSVDLDATDITQDAVYLASVQGSFQGDEDGFRGLAELGQLESGELVFTEGKLQLSHNDRGQSVGLELVDPDRELWQSELLISEAFDSVEVEKLVLVPDGGVWRLEAPTQILLLDDGVVVPRIRLVDHAGAVLQGEGSYLEEEWRGNLQLQDVPLRVVNSFVAQKGHQGSVNGTIELQEIEGLLALSGSLRGRKIKIPDRVLGVRLDLDFNTESAGNRVDFVLGRGKKDMGHGTVQIPLVQKPRVLALDWTGVLDGKFVFEPTDNKIWKACFPEFTDLPKGRSAATATLAGTPKKPIITLDSGLDWQLAEGPQYARSDISLRHENGVLKGSGSSRQSGRPMMEWSLALDTGVEESLSWLAGDSPKPPLHLWDHWWQDGQVRVLANDMEIDSIQPLLPESAPFKGKLNGSFLITGRPSRPMVYGGFYLNEGFLGEVEVPVSLVNVYADDDGYDVYSYSELAGETLTMDGRINMDLDGEGRLKEKLAKEIVDVTIQGAVPVGVVNAWSPASARNGKGAVVVKGTVEGSVLRPKPELALTLKNGELDWVPEALRLTEMQLEGRFTEKGLYVPRYSLKTAPLKERNSLKILERKSSLSGSLLYPIREDGDASLELVAEDAWISATADQVARVDGGLSAEGPLDSLFVEGRFVVNEGRYVMTSEEWLSEGTLNLNSGIQLIRSGSVIEATRKTPPIWSKWTYGLDIDLGPNTWIEAEVPLSDGYGAVATKVSTVGLVGRLDGEVRAESLNGAPVLQGEVDILKGTAKVFGTDFDVETGELMFTGATLLDPNVEISAVYPSPHYGDIRVGIQGQPADLRLDFSSDEGWSDTDMAAILLFKRPASSMTQSEGGAGLDLLGAAIGVMAGQASQLLRMSNLVDLVEVESSGEAISAVRLGWSIGDDLFLTYAQDYAAEVDENSTEMTLEWLLSRRFQAEVSTGNAGESSADLYMRWRF